MELCSLFMSEDGKKVVEKTDAAREWMGWLAIDVGIGKFELEQWLKACNIDLKNRRPDGVIESDEDIANNSFRRWLGMCGFDEVMDAIVSAEYQEVEDGTQ